jgi:two-component system, OmpR family, sensor kinase
VFERWQGLGLRSRLVAAILLVAVAVLAGSFVALHARTGSELNQRIDEGLRDDLHEFQGSSAASATTSAQLAHRAQQFVDGQGYHADSRIFAIEVPGAGVVTNERQVIGDQISEPGPAEGDEHSEPDHASGRPGGQLLAAAAGLETLSDPVAGKLRVLTAPIHGPSGPIGTFRVAAPLGSVSAAQGSLRDTIVVVGAIALGILIVAALWIATVVSRPLTRIARFAHEVDTEGLDHRLEVDRGPAEVRSLAESFNRMLDRLQRAFGREREFVADASHELRTPVTIAQGELDLLRRDVGPAERKRLDGVRRELVRMERLISEMLTLAAADSPDALRREPVSVRDLLDDLRRDLPLLGSRRYTVDDLGGTVDADPDRLAQVFRNLVRNAVAHTDADGSVEVRAAALRDRVRFEIRDDGAGFAPGEAERAFDRFYRTEAGHTRDADGAGLGLAIARAIVDAHGGSIRAVGRPGGGATIVFELPGYRAG